MVGQLAANGVKTIRRGVLLGNVDFVIKAYRHGIGTVAIIPGHDAIAHQADLVAYRDMAVTIRDRIQAMLEQGMTLEQVKAMHPMKEYTRNPDRDPKALCGHQ
jgi:hypothetical protein